MAVASSVLRHVGHIIAWFNLLIVVLRLNLVNYWAKTDLATPFFTGCDELMT